MTAVSFTAVPLSAVPISAVAGHPVPAPRSSVPAVRPVAGRPTLRLVPTGRAVPARPRSSSVRSSVRLTRRGRAALTVVATCAVAACTALVLHAAAPTTDRPASVVVGPGQTLSQVAHAALPDLPVGEAVTQLQLANRLNSLQVGAGQRLVIPR